MGDKIWMWDLKEGDRNENIYRSLAQELFRPFDLRTKLDSKKIKNIFFVGNGAIKDGSEPIINWITTYKPDRENSQIQSYIQFLHSLGKEALKNMGWELALTFIPIFLKASYIKERNSKISDKEQSVFSQTIHLRNALAEQFKIADPKRRILPHDLEQVLVSDETLVVCANWDEACWKSQEIKNIIQIHGICSHPETMIFPTESTLDPLPGCDENNADVVDVLKQLHRVVLNAIDNVEFVYVWGLALEAYEAEIRNFLFLIGHEAKNPKLIVINPDIKAACRAAMLMHANDFEFRDPNLMPIRNLKETLERLS